MLDWVQVLSPILLPTDLHSIFGRVAALFSKSLAEAFTRLEPRVSYSFQTLPLSSYCKQLQHAVGVLALLLTPDLGLPQCSSCQGHTLDCMQLKNSTVE